MKIEIRFRGMAVSGAIQEHVVRRTHFQLGRYGDVTAVTVRIADINGPKGGVDKRCQVTVRGLGFAPVVIEDLSEDVHAAVDLAVTRAARAVGREIARARTRAH